MATLYLHPAGSSFVGSITVEEEHVDEKSGMQKNQRPHAVIIMDNSGSMGGSSRRMLNEVFPEMLDLMGYGKDDSLLLITFSSATSHYHMRIGDLSTFKPGPQGTTNMRGVFEVLAAQLSCTEKRHVQLLTLSDGAVNDSEQTIQQAALVAPTLRDNYQIEARAVRLFTSTYGQPDTRALASVLQLSTHNASTLVDLPSNAAGTVLAQQMAAMFGLGTHRSLVLQTSSPTLQLQPWSEPKNILNIKLGKNTFWLTSPPQELTLNEAPVQVAHREAVTQGTMGALLNDRIEFFVSQLKVLKVINSEKAKEQISQIVQYFKSFEASLAPDEELQPLLDSGKLEHRAQFLCKNVQRRLKSVTGMMESIANDDRVQRLNQAQQADYLRRMEVSKNARGLARRAEAAGLDFDGTLREEILQMKAHLAELDDLNDSSHEISFISQATTLEGIKQVCEMANDTEMFEQFQAVDLLRVFNVVGIPAVAGTGDYPDPMTYRLDKLIPGTYVSVADLSVCEMGGGKLHAPGTDDVIVNAIPVFDDPRIQRFLLTYAPSALEYICSIGMRRVLAEVPKTYPYTVCAGIWKMVEHLNTNKSELNVKLLQRMVPSYNESLQGYFDYLMPALETNQDPDKSYFLNHNGITNMISPIWRLVEAGQTQYMSRILRALYTYEVYQAMRRICKHQSEGYIVETLDRLLGVDFELRGTPLPEMFSRTEPNHRQGVVLHKELFAELCKSFGYVKFVTLIPSLFCALRRENPVQEVNGIPEVTDETIAEALGLDYPLDEFLLYNVVEGFLFQNKQSRIDKVTNKPLRPDLGNRSAGQKMCADYLQGRYSEDYECRLRQMAGEERRQLSDDLVQRLASTESTEGFCTLLRDGICRDAVTLKIANVNSLGCTELHDALMDISHEVPLRVEKLYVFYTGEDSTGNSIWNGGNMFRTPLAPLKNLLTGLGEITAWERIDELYRTRKSHIYRTCPSCNRHGHSNDLPSFFAFGHQSLASFIHNITPDAWKEYQVKHSACCGVQQYLSDNEVCKGR